MRSRALLIGVLLAASCAQPAKPDNVAKYCVLTTMPRTTASDLQAMHDRGVALFKQRKPYLKTVANQRVIDAATLVVGNAEGAAVQVEHPQLFPGQPPLRGLDASIEQLSLACLGLSASATPSASTG